MSRPIIIVVVLSVAAAVPIITFVVVKSDSPGEAEMSEEQHRTREQFFGADKKVPPIPKGQEMRPRW